MGIATFERSNPQVVYDRIDPGIRGLWVVGEVLVTVEQAAAIDEADLLWELGPRHDPPQDFRDRSRETGTPRLACQCQRPGRT